MAIANPLQPFLWGSGGEQMTPQQVARQREIADALMGSVGNTSPVQHWLQGVPRLTNALGFSMREGLANEQETRGREAGRAHSDRVLGSIFGGGSPIRTADTGSVASLLAEPAVTSTPALDAATGLAGAAPLPEGTEWLNYANQGATRNLPLSEQLKTALSFLPELGVTMEVFSGGQPEAGQGPRVGSTRHDHGNAADVFFYRDGQQLDWAIPEHLPIFEEIVRRGRAAGLTGFGAGDGYMRPGSMHIGFGPEAVWGAGGQGENAPEWLRNAFYGATPGSAPAASGALVQVAQAPSYDMNALLGLATDPWADETSRSIAMSLAESQMAQQARMNDPMYQLEMELLQEELNAQRNPDAPDPIEVGGVLLDPVTYEPIFDSRQPDVPAAEEQIARLMETGLTRNQAIGVADGRYRVDRHPVTGVSQVVDVATGEIVSAPQAQPQPDTPQQSQISPEVMEQFGTQFPAAEDSFGVGGTFRGIANTVGDVIGAGAPYPEVQQTQADFGVLRESLLNDVASAYGRQPPSWLLQEIRNLTPAAGSPLEGTGGAQSKLNALGRHLTNELAIAEQSLQRELSPQNRQELEARVSGLQAGIARVQGALRSFGGNETQGGPAVGTVEDGYRFLGGDPADPNSWERVQ